MLRNPENIGVYPNAVIKSDVNGYILTCSKCEEKVKFGKEDKTIKCSLCDCIYEVNISEQEINKLREKEIAEEKDDKTDNINKDKQQELKEDDNNKSEEEIEVLSIENENDDNDSVNSKKSEKIPDKNNKKDEIKNHEKFKSVFKDFMSERDSDKEQKIDISDISDQEINKLKNNKEINKGKRNKDVNKEKEKPIKSIDLNDLQLMVEHPQIQQLLLDAIQEKNEDNNNNNNNNNNKSNKNIEQFVRKVKKLKKKARKYEEAFVDCDLDVSDITSLEDGKNENTLYYTPPKNERLDLTEDIEPDKIKEVLDSFSESFPGLLVSRGKYQKKSDFSTIVTCLKRVLVSSNNNKLINSIKKDGAARNCKIAPANIDGKKSGNVGGLTALVIIQHALQQICIMNIKQPYAMLLSVLELLYVLYSHFSLVSECNEYLMGNAVKKFINLNARPGVNYISKFREIKRDFEAAIIKYEDNPNKYLTISRFCLRKIRTGWCNNKSCKLLHFCVECNSNNCDHFRKTGNAFYNQNKYFDLVNNKNRGYSNYNNSNWRGRGRGNWRGRGNFNRYNNYNNNNNNGYMNGNFQPSDQFTPPSNNNNNRRGGQTNSGRGRGN